MINIQVKPIHICIDAHYNARKESASNMFTKINVM